SAARGFAEGKASTERQDRRRLMTQPDPSINARRTEALSRAVNQSLPPLTTVDVGLPKADPRKTNPNPAPAARPIDFPGLQRDAARRLIRPPLRAKPLAPAAAAVDQRLRQLTPVDRRLPNPDLAKTNPPAQTGAPPSA